MSEVLLWSQILVILFLIVVGVVLGIGGSLGVSRVVGERFFPWIIPIISLSIIAKTVVGGRNVDLYVLNPAYDTSQGAAGSIWILRALMWPMIGYCFGYIINRLIGKSVRRTGAEFVFIAFLVNFLCGTVLNSVLGANPSLDYKHFYVLVLVVAVYLAGDGQLRVVQFINNAKLSFNFSLAVGLLAALIFPSIAVQTKYDGALIPGVGFRLWGLDSHANTFGPLAAVALLMELTFPYKVRSRHWGSLIVGLLALLLAQSKTSWGLFLAAFSVWLVIRLFQNLGEDLQKGRSIRLISIAPIIVLAVFILALAVYLVTNGFESSFSRYLMTKEAGALASMTGRDRIWSITLDAWLDNPIFGYGPQLWGPEFSARYGLLGTASNAHNQLIDILGNAGIVGLVAFIVYWASLAIGAWKVRDRLGLLPMVILFALSVRGISEVPFRMINVQSNDFSFHFLLLTLLFFGLRKENSRSSEMRSFPKT